MSNSRSRTETLGSAHGQVAAGTLRQVLAQLAAQDFAGGGARDGVYEMHFARLLVVGQSVGYEGAELAVELVGRSEAIAEDDEGAGDFSGLGVGLGDYAAIANRGMLE